MFTRWPLAVATRKADAITAATFLYEEVFTKFGPITTLLSDNGSHFANQVLEKYVALCNARHKFGTPYHPENQGMVEKLNHTLVTAIKKLSVAYPSEWDTHLNTILYSYRVRAHESIGISPYELLFGVVPVDAERDPLLAFGKTLGYDRLLALPELRNEAILKDARERSRMPAVDYVRFLPGTMVLHKNFNKSDKLDANWVDKVFTVVSAFKNNTYLLANAQTGKLLKRRTNGTHLRKYFDRDNRKVSVVE
ncbi:hypothetical protein [Parasitella parasitica]|uniref:Integrase catalytic domain-containing protein n=1 Tax=Parasitella parasitica TaxID=35722 RepID=A0A0B7N7U0_9FUNG|nr:hypothetical protein [Parasitella parasitica]